MKATIVHGEEKTAAVAGLETFLRNHADGIASMDFVPGPDESRFGSCTVSDPTIRPRELVWLGVSAHPSRCAERLLGSIRWDFLDHVIVFHFPALETCDRLDNRPQLVRSAIDHLERNVENYRQ